MQSDLGLYWLLKRYVIVSTAKRIKEPLFEIFRIWNGRVSVRRFSVDDQLTIKNRTSLPCN